MVISYFKKKIKRALDLDEDLLIWTNYALITSTTRPDGAEYFARIDLLIEAEKKTGMIFK